jgi:hypothetical protein
MHLVAPYQWRTEGGGVWGGSTPPKFRRFDKAEPNSQFRGKYIRLQPNHNTGFTHLQIEWNP